MSSTTFNQIYTNKQLLYELERVKEHTSVLKSLKTEINKLFQGHSQFQYFSKV